MNRYQCLIQNTTFALWKVLLLFSIIEYFIHFLNLFSESFRSKFTNNFCAMHKAYASAQNKLKQGYSEKLVNHWVVLVFTLARFINYIF